MQARSGTSIDHFTGSNMLFSKMCGCASPTEFFSRNTDLDRRDLLCAGGAGFVSALVATMCGAAKVARAQTLGRTIPEVDRLSVRIITDNYVFFLYALAKTK